MNRLFFKPWEGKYYKRKKERILLLGESHYSNNEVDPDFTCEIINEYLDGSYLKYFRNITNLIGEDDSIWNSVSFSNIFQTKFESSSQLPNNEQINCISPVFFQLLNTLEPNKTIVLSRRLWNWIPDKNGIMIDSIMVGRRHSNIWEYYYNTGKTKAIGICHPSWMFGKNGTIEEWKLLVDKLIKL